MDEDGEESDEAGAGDGIEKDGSGSGEQSDEEAEDTNSRRRPRRPERLGSRENFWGG
jgi:hypothetical protein